MMAKRSRIIVLVASLALGLMYVLPVWTIDLEAPQYPEGIGMLVQINTVEGQKEHDLNNINNLNHYIGMKRIVPESIPELKLMPYIVAGLMVLGLLVAAVGRRWLLNTWVALFLGVSLAGMVDFWMWEYDYGHNLDPEAAIQVPGMSYQPPLIGSKQILNFTAHSWPGGGGWAAILACTSAVLVAGYELRRRKQEREGARSESPSGSGDRPSGTVGAVLVLALALGACGEPQPRDIALNVDTCASCLMNVGDAGHATELVAVTGKVYTFDSVECLASHLAHAGVDLDVHSVWVSDFSNPGTLVRAEDAHFLVSATLKSPMGLGITAFARMEDRDGAVHSFGGDPMRWAEVQTYVEAAWPDGRVGAPHGGHASNLVPSNG